MFGQILSDLIAEYGVSKVELCRRALVSRPYLYSILSGEVKPPTREIQLRIASSLNLNQFDSCLLFDAAALERNEVPADMADYLKDANNRSELRKIIHEKRGSK